MITDHYGIHVHGHCWCGRFHKWPAKLISETLAQEVREALQNIQRSEPIYE
jgi:hypothetical protein